MYKYFMVLKEDRIFILQKNLQPGSINVSSCPDPGPALSAGILQKRCWAHLSALYQFTTILTCSITGNINLKCMVKLLAASFLHCKVTVFPFVLVCHGETFWIMPICVPHQASTHQPEHPLITNAYQLSLRSLPNGDYLFPLFLLHLWVGVLL